MHAAQTALGGARLQKLGNPDTTGAIQLVLRAEQTTCADKQQQMLRRNHNNPQ
jgi:hypothetical protein